MPSISQIMNSLKQTPSQKGMKTYSRHHNMDSAGVRFKSLFKFSIFKSLQHYRRREIMVFNKKSVREEIERLGFKVIYVQHEVIEDYNACYRVEYKGKLIFPPAANKLDIPLNEIWISEKWREFEKYILYHELREIKYRAEGYAVERAHKLASRDANEKFRGDQNHESLRREINITSKETLMELAGIEEDLFQKLVKNRPYHSMGELLEKIPSMEKKNSEE